MSLAEKILRKKIPMFVHFDLTYHCNLKCVHCYVVPQERPELSTEEIKGILRQLAKAGTLCLSLSGGEPLVRRDFFEIAEYARGLNLVPTLLTNATLIDGRIADRIAALNPLGVQISIYGAKPEIHDAVSTVPGSFSKSINAARMLVERGVKVTLAYIVMKGNVDYYQEVMALVEEMEADFTVDENITPRMDGNRGPLAFQINEDELLKIYRDPKINPIREITASAKLSGANELRADVGCKASHSYCSISPYGDVYPCGQLLLPCGNLREESFEHIWQHSSNMHRARSATTYLPPVCSECELLKYCQRCPGLALAEDGDLWGPSSRACRNARIKKRAAEEQQFANLYEKNKKGGDKNGEKA